VISQREIAAAITPEYPVYSSQTSDDGVMGYLDSYDFDGEYVTWTTDGVNAGTVFYRNGKFNCTNVCGTIRLHHDNHYLVSRVLARFTPQFVSRNLANPKLMNDVLKEIRIPLPATVEEQRAVAAVLSEFDALVDGLQSLIAKKRAVSRATARQLLAGQRRLPQFRGQMGRCRATPAGTIPDDWELSSLGSVADLLTGYPFPSRLYSDSGVRLLRGSNVKRGYLDWSDGITEYWPSVNSDVERYLLKEGDLVVAMDGALVGKSYAVITSSDLPCLLLQRVSRLRAKCVDARFLPCLLSGDSFAKYVDSVKTETAIPHITSRDVDRFPVVLPHRMEEQRAIADVLADMNAEIAALDRRRKKTQAIQRGIAQALLTGRVRLI